MKRSLVYLLSASLMLINITSCSKDKDSGSNPVTSPPTGACDGKTIVLTATATGGQPCGGNNGSISASATGSTGFTYKLNSGGTYQASGDFSVAPGNYTVFAKDADGCEKSTSVTVGTAAAGPLFTNVKNLIASRCQSCHNPSNLNGGKNWADQCNIIQSQDRIKVRAVDEGTMPQGGPELTASEKKIITDWINAGGAYNN